MAQRLRRKHILLRSRQSCSRSKVSQSSYLILICTRVSDRDRSRIAGSRCSLCSCTRLQVTVTVYSHLSQRGQIPCLEPSLFLNLLTNRRFEEHILINFFHVFSHRTSGPKIGKHLRLIFLNNTLNTKPKLFVLINILTKMLHEFFYLIASNNKWIIYTSNNNNLIISHFFIAMLYQLWKIVYLFSG